MESNIKLYPNPATDILNINLGNTNLENQVKTISIIGIKGDLIYKTDKFKSAIDVKNLSKGTYFVKIQIDNNLIPKKIIIESRNC